jgi:hypothetical protein
VDASNCGILGDGLTAILAQLLQLIDIDREAKYESLIYTKISNHWLTSSRTTALVSCDISGTSYAFCHARKTISVQGTLAAKDLKWMTTPVTDMRPLSTPTQLPSKAEGIRADVPEPPLHQSTTAVSSTKWTWVICSSLVLLGYLIKSYHFCLVKGRSNIYLAV